MDTPDIPTVADVIRDYLALGVRDLTRAPLKDKQHTLGQFSEAYGERLVSEMKAIDLQRWIAAHPSWESPWTRKRVLASVKSAFNWAMNNDLIPRNPFRAVREGPGSRRRAMTDHELRAIMRHSNQWFRRFAFMCARTGMRPAEVASIQWTDIDWERGAIVLKKHKTARKTGKPRVIPLTNCVRKLLQYLWRHSPMGIMEVLKPLIENGPVTATHVLDRLRFHNSKCVKHCWTAWTKCQHIKLALAALGVEKFRVNGESGLQHWMYRIPSNAKAVPLPDAYQFVFLHKRNRPWYTSVTVQYMRRLKDKGVIQNDCQLYGARHKYATDAIRNKVPIHAVSQLLGHASVKQTEHYLHTSGDVSYLIEHAEQATVTKPAANVPPVRTVRRLSAIVTTRNA